MTTINNGVPAFPHEYKYGDGTAHRNDGMTLRDYFAIHSGATSEGIGVETAEKMVGRKAPDWASDATENIKFWAEVRAKLAYIEADAFLRAREAK